MKQQTIIYPLLASLLLAGCTAFETDVAGGEGTKEASGMLAIRSLGLSVETKTAYEGIGAGGAGKLGEIGVLVTKEDADGQTVYYSSKFNTQTFTCSVVDEKPLWTPAAATALTLDNTDGILYAWAPVDQADAPGKLSAGDTPAPIVESPKIRSVQTFAYGNEWNTDQADYLYGSAAATAGNDTHSTVNRTDYVVKDLYMQHALAKVSFRIMKAKDQTVSTTEDYVKRIKLSRTQPVFIVTPTTTRANLTMSLADGSLADAGGDATSLSDTLVLTATACGKVAAYAAKAGVEPEAPDFGSLVSAQAYGLAAPVNAGALVLELTLGPDGALDPAKDRTYQSGKDALPNVVWTKGKHYLYTMTVSDRGLAITNVSVVGWDDTPPAVDVPVDPADPVDPVAPAA